MSQPSPKPRNNLPPALRGLPPGAQIPGQRPMRTDGLNIRASDADYTQLEDIRSRQADSIKSFITDNMVKHTAWNRGWIDATWRPITPPLDTPDDESDVDPLGTELKGWKHIDPVMGAGAGAQGSASLPTPPASIASPPADDDTIVVVNANKSDPPARNTRSRNPSTTDKPRTVSFATDSLPSPEPVRPVFRQRTGRGGRVMIDRRVPKRTHVDAFAQASPPHHALPHHSIASSYNLRDKKKDVADDGSDSGVDMSDPYHSTIAELRALDRFAYDNDDDDEEDEGHRLCIFSTDPYENMNIRYRMMWARGAEEQRQAQQAQLAAQRARLSISSQGGTDPADQQAQAVKSGS